MLRPSSKIMSKSTQLKHLISSLGILAQTFIHLPPLPKHLSIQHRVRRIIDRLGFGIFIPWLFLADEMDDCHLGLELVDCRHVEAVCGVEFLKRKESASLPFAINEE